MAENITHDRLNRRAETWLLANAYPLPAANASNSKSSLDAKDLPLVLRVAELHGVLPAIVRAAERDFAAQGNDVAATCRAVLDNGRLKVAYYTGQGLLLAHHAGRVMTAFRAANLRAAVVKGAIAARRLYPQPALRTFTDVDVVIDPQYRSEVGDIMRGLGFELVGYRDDGYCEDCWLLSSNKNVMVEIHSNLVHSPNLRSTFSLGYDDIIAAGDGDPEAAAALLLIAAAHGSVGHQFERLQLVIDVALAASGAAGPIDADRLRDVARLCGLMPALIGALDLAGRTYRDPKIHDLARRLDTSLLARLPGLMLTPRLVIRMHDPNRVYRSWRRKIFRQLIKLGPPQRSGQPHPNTDAISGPTEAKSEPTRSS